MIFRPTTPADTQTLLKLAEETAVFKSHEIVALREVLEDFHSSPKDHQAYITEINAEVAGFIYFAPAAMTENVWYLYWIFVKKDLQGRSLGSKLLALAEDKILQARGRLLLIETSGLPHYLPTRKFYLKHGYTLEAVVHDF
nr:GNAT family N-acetyltransferase [Gemmatales bacterium]